MAVVRLPRTSNATDVDALACEPGVVVRWTVSPAEVLDADLVVLPGSRATVADLAWLRGHGHRRRAGRAGARAGIPCWASAAGTRCSPARSTDDVESGAGTVAGLGLLPTRVRFARDEDGAPGHRVAPTGEPVTTAYEIHHGQVDLDPAAAPAAVSAAGRAAVSGAAPAAVSGAEPFLDGCRWGAVWGTTWHGALDSDGFRRAFLAEVAAVAGRDFTPAPDTDVAALRAARLDLLADLVADHLDTGALRRLITDGPTPGLPFIPPGASA